MFFCAFLSATAFKVNDIPSCVLLLLFDWWQLLLILKAHIIKYNALYDRRLMRFNENKNKITRQYVSGQQWPLTMILFLLSHQNANPFLISLGTKLILIRLIYFNHIYTSQCTCVFIVHVIHLTSEQDTGELL